MEEPAQQPRALLTDVLWFIFKTNITQKRLTIPASGHLEERSSLLPERNLKYALHLAHQIGEGKPLMKSRDAYLSAEEHILAVRIIVFDWTWMRQQVNGRSFNNLEK